VWGGDGTVNEAAGALAFGDVPLGIVPAGSGNGLARVLGIPFDPRAALGRCLDATPRAIDVGEIDDRLFVNIAGIGFDAHVAARFNRPDNRRRGLIGYAVLTARELPRYAAHEYRITVGDSVSTVRALFVVLANGTEFGNCIRIAPGARVDDGELALIIVREQSRLSTICQIPRILGDRVERSPAWSLQPVRAATIECESPMLFHVDGEPVQGGTRIEARVHPGALRVCA